MGLLGIVGCGALWGLGCIEPPRIAPRDAGRDAPPGPPALVVTGLEVRGFDGRLYPLDAAPRRPRLVLSASAPFTGEVPIHLFAGEADAALLDDLGASPLRREHLDRVVPSGLGTDGSRLELVPREPLVPGAVYTLALAAWAEREGRELGVPSSWRLVVGRGTELGAAAVFAWPPDGAVEVGTALDAAVIGFDGALGGLDGLALLGPDGPVAATRQTVDCAAFGRSGTCVALRPVGRLAGRTEHALRVEGATDAAGAPVPTFAARFVTASGPDAQAPTLLALPCFVDELPTLQRLPALKDAIQESRKYNLRFVLGFQGRSQLEQRYGREAEALMSAPDIRIFLKTSEPRAAEWIAQNIGQPRKEREQVSFNLPLIGLGRESLSRHTEERTDYLVYPNEIQTLAEREGYFCYGKYAVKIQFPYPSFLRRRNTLKVASPPG